jgi:EAL domain-containing protein (putative c-di-GMP-specific phosphodiesterase class I)/ActR/RegA family two-component response regulator
MRNDGERSTATRGFGQVLLVDDDPEVLDTYSRLISRNGYRVSVAKSAGEAQSLLNEQSFDAIVSDIVMPAMTGLEFLRVVRGVDLDVPVILMTGAPDVETACKAVEYGAFRYLAKPIAPAVLLESVGKAVRLHRLARVKREAFKSAGGQGRWLGDRAGLEVRFQRALDRLWMAYHAVVAQKDHTVFGYEALVRSGEPTFDTPADLLAVADQLGRLHDLGRAIRARVTLDSANAPEGAQLFVNIHVDDLNDLELVLPTAPLSAISERVVLEITERSRLDSVQGLGVKVTRLREQGFRIAVDDVGAGYAGLSSFALLEPDLIKIDMSLIRDIDASKAKQSIVRSMLQLATRDLGMLVICEGVETPAERDALIWLGANLLQGHLFGKPSREFVVSSW